MPLMTTKPMFDLAYDGGFAVGAFNVNNMELAQAIIDACAKESSPCILQISKGARKYANIRYLKAIIDAGVAEHPELPIAVHCDHGDTLDLIQTCVNDGYTSVMIDGSHHPYEENVKLSADAVKIAHAAGVVVEAELGMLGGIEEEVVGLDAEEYAKNIDKFLTNADEAADFWKRTGVDSLAVAIGTSHGAFKFKHEAKLAFDRVEQIMKTCPGLPLVMHGSSSVPQEFIDLVNKYGGAMPNAKGVPEDQISQAVRKYGVCKVNIDTDLRLAMTAKIREVFATKPAEFDPRNYLGPAREAITSMVQRKLHVLNSAGKAEAVNKQWEKEGKPMPSYYGKKSSLVSEPTHNEPGLIIMPTTARIVGGVAGFAFAGIGVTVLVFLWSAPFGAWDSPPLFFRIFGSFIAIVFVAVGGTLGFASAAGKALPNQMARLARKAATNAPPMGSGNYRCRSCGAPLPSGTEVSPLGDVRCPFCKAWMNIHRVG